MRVSSIPYALLVSAISCIKEGNIEVAKVDFETFLQEAKEIGDFNLVTWSAGLRQKAYDFGKAITHEQMWALSAIDKEPENEFFLFLKSEIVLNIWDDEAVFDFVSKQQKRFPGNPEFKQTLINLKLKSGYDDESMLRNAIGDCKFILKIDPTNDNFIRSLGNVEQAYVDTLIANGKYQEASEYALVVIRSRFYINNYHGSTHNALVILNSRCKDHLIWQKRMQESEKEFLVRMQKELDSDRKKTVELLAFFTGIIALIFSAVQVANNKSYKEGIGLIIALGTVLIVFATVLSILFGSSNKAHADKNFPILVAILIMNVLYAAILLLGES